MVAAGEAVLITGVYGTGKTPVCEELAGPAVAGLAVTSPAC
jgi:broad-specificity NMP kinase